MSTPLTPEILAVIKARCDHTRELFQANVMDRTHDIGAHLSHIITAAGDAIYLLEEVERLQAIEAENVLLKAALETMYGYARAANWELEADTFVEGRRWSKSQKWLADKAEALAALGWEK